MEFKLVLFDLDDTLIYFKDYWEVSTKETFRVYSYTRELDPDKLFNVYKVKDLVFERQYLDQIISIEDYRRNRFISTLAEFGIVTDGEHADGFENTYKSISKDYMKAHPEITELLTYIIGKWHVGVVTNGTATWQYAKIDALGYNTVASRSLCKVGRCIHRDDGYLKLLSYCFSGEAQPKRRRGS